MEVKILNGKIIAEEIKKDLKRRIDFLYNKTGNRPCLAIISMNNDYANDVYVKMKVATCKEVGIKTLVKNIDDNFTTEEVLNLVDKLNKDKNIDGIIIQHPLSEKIDEQLCFDKIVANKDVDGVSNYNLGAIMSKMKGFKPATVNAIENILKYYNIDVTGKNIVIVGRSIILGKPLAMTMINKDATVLVCHSKTENLNNYLKMADIIVAAVGKPKFIKGNNLKNGVIIIDAGYNKGNVGDVDIESCIEKVSAYTPVPGGVGPVTIAKLLEQTVISFENKNNL